MMDVAELKPDSKWEVSVVTSGGENASVNVSTDDADFMPSPELLSRGFMNQILPKVGSVQDRVTDITKNQDVLLESLQKESEEMDESNVNKEIEVTLAELKYYREKLVSIRSDMVRLHEKTNKMKRRSIKLKQMRDKNDVQLQERRHKELEQEKSLVAKPAPKPP